MQPNQYQPQQQNPYDAAQDSSGNSFYRPQDPSQYLDRPSQPEPKKLVNDAVSWDASEYIHNSKGGLWVVGFLLIFVTIAAVAVWIGSWIFFVLVVLMAATAAIFAFRKPHVHHYTISSQGISIDQTNYAFSDFRAFGVMQEGALFTMTFVPVKRFSPGFNIYFSGTDGIKIIKIAGQHLPMEKMKPDIIDKITSKLHF